MYKKAYEVMEELRNRRFCMTTREFYKTTVMKVLVKYNIREDLSVEEYYKLLKLMLEECSLHDLKNAGLEYFDENDWKDK